MLHRTASAAEPGPSSAAAPQPPPEEASSVAALLGSAWDPEGVFAGKAGGLNLAAGQQMGDLIARRQRERAQRMAAAAAAPAVAPAPAAASAAAAGPKSSPVLPEGLPPIRPLPLPVDPTSGAPVASLPPPLRAELEQLLTRYACSGAAESAEAVGAGEASGARLPSASQPSRHHPGLRRRSTTAQQPAGPTARPPTPTCARSHRRSCCCCCYRCCCAHRSHMPVDLSTPGLRCHHLDPPVLSADAWLPAATCEALMRAASDSGARAWLPGGGGAREAGGPSVWPAAHDCVEGAPEVGGLAVKLTRCRVFLGPRAR